MNVPKNWVNHKTTHRTKYGLADVHYNRKFNRIYFTYRGNMGGDHDNQRDKLAMNVFGKTIEDLKAIGEVVFERGTADYLWELELDFNVDYFGELELDFNDFNGEGLIA